MKAIKVIIIGIAIILVAIFLLKKPKNLNLEGHWTATKIVFNGKDLLASDPMAKLFPNSNEVFISQWADSLQIITASQYKANASFEIVNAQKAFSQIILTSTTPSLNGNFAMQIDTTHIGPQAYRVSVKIGSNKTVLHFEKFVNIPPWKPEFPKKGKV